MHAVRIGTARSRSIASDVIREVLHLYHWLTLYALSSSSAMQKQITSEAALSRADMVSHRTTSDWSLTTTKHLKMLEEEVSRGQVSRFTLTDSEGRNFSSGVQRKRYV